MMPDRQTIIEILQKALDNAEIDGLIYAEVRRPVVFDIINLLKEQENASKRNPVIVCPHCGKRIK